MPSGWKDLTWGDLATLEYGKGLRSYQYTDGPYPVYGTNGQIGWHNEPLCDGPGIIIGRKGAYRGVHFSEKPFFVIDTAFYLKPKGSHFDIKWAYYQLLNFDINNVDSGTAIPSTSREAFYAIPVSLPPLPPQRKIAAILSAYDDLIENNTRRIALLEEMARRLYREWFVRFRFPGHQSARMVDSPLGRIPEGWEVRRFTEVADVLSGGTPRTSVPEYWGGEIAWFTPKDIPDTFYVLDTERKITELGLSKCNSQLYPADTVFITARGTVGRCVLAAVPMAMSQTSYALLGRERIPQYFIYLLTLSLVDVFKQNATGAVFDTIVVDTFRNQYVAVPSSELLLRFNETVAPIFSQIKNLQRRRDVLRRTRDMLLPRLVSGALDVAGLEIAVGD